MNGDDKPATRADLSELRGEFKSDLNQLRGEFKSDLNQFKDELTELVRSIETNLLRAFSDFNTSTNIRYRKMEADISNIDASTTQRLGELERRVTELTTRVIQLEGPR